MFLTKLWRKLCHIPLVGMYFVLFWRLFWQNLIKLKMLNSNNSEIPFLVEKTFECIQQGDKIMFITGLLVIAKQPQEIS